MDGGRVLHFAIGPRRFAVRVTDILEIREVPTPTAVPGAPAVVSGLVEIRGRIVTLVDLARVFGMNVRSGPDLLAVQFAEPLAHLGLLIADNAHNVETDATAEDPLSEELAASPAHAPEPGLGTASDEKPESGEAGASLGREIVLSGARPALLLDPAALVAFCTRRVRERFIVAG